MNCTPRARYLAADYPFTRAYLSLFYHTTSHYLCHGPCHQISLVEIALGLPRQFDDFKQKVHFHQLALKSCSN